MKENLEFQCASILKPIYARICNAPNWYSLVKSSICYSDNEATDILTNSYLANLHANLTALSKCKVLPSQTWGKFLVTTPMVENLYEALRKSSDVKSNLIKILMNNTSPTQKFSVPGAVKSGWDLYSFEEQNILVTHVVQLLPESSKVLLSKDIIDDSLANQWRHRLKHDGPMGVIGIHKELAQQRIDTFFSVKA